MYAIAAHFTDEAIDAMIDAQYQPQLGIGPPRTATGHCALGVGLCAMGIPGASVYPAPSALCVGRLLLLADAGAYLDGRQRDVCLAIANDAAEFVMDFDKGRLLGDDLRRAFGRPTLAAQFEAAIAEAEALLARETVGV